MNKMFAFALVGMTAFLASPVFAGDGTVTQTGLTTSQVFSQLGGYTCGGSTCSQSVSGSRDETVGGEHYISGPISRCGKFVGVFDINCNPMQLAETFSSPSSMSIATVTDITKTLTYNSPDNWTIVTVTETHDK